MQIYPIHKNMDHLWHELIAIKMVQQEYGYAAVFFKLELSEIANCFLLEGIWMFLMHRLMWKHPYTFSIQSASADFQ